MEERVVERVDLLVAQATQRGAAEHREDVADDVAFLALVGAGGEVELLDREPLAGEVGAEGKRSHSFDPAGLLGCQLLSLGPPDGRNPKEHSGQAEAAE